MKKSIHLLFVLAFSSFCLNAINRVSTGNGDWNVAGTWSPAGVPSGTDNITIQSGHTVNIINASAFCNDLSIDGNLLFTDNVAGRVLWNYGNLNVSATGSFSVSPVSDKIHVVGFYGNVTNNGVIDLFTDANSWINCYINKVGNQSFTGTGVFDIYRITIQNGAIGNVTEFACSNFTTNGNGWLTLNSGTIKFSFPGAITTTPFAASVTLSASCGLWINSSSSTINVGGSIYVNGRYILDNGTNAVSGSMSCGNSTNTGTVTINNGTLNLTNQMFINKGTLTVNNGTVNLQFNTLLTDQLVVNGGTLNIGNAGDERLIADGGRLTINAGNVNVAGRIDRNTTSSVFNYVMAGGTLTVPTVGTTMASASPFGMLTAGGSFSMTNGTIIIPKSGPSNLGIDLTGASTASVTGGTLQIGSGATPASTTINIKSPISLYNLTVNSANVTARVFTNSLTLQNDVNIVAGTLNALNLNITVGGNWSNTGNAFVPGGTSCNVTFNRAGNQTITRAAGETFNDLTLSGSGTKSLGGPINARGITINSALDVSASNHAINLTGTWTNNGTFTAQSGTVTFNGSSGAQSIGGTNSTSFYGLTCSNSSGVNVPSATVDVTDALTVTAGTLNNSGGTFTLVSDASKTARIGSSNGSFAGTFIIQKHISARAANWHDLSSPVSTTTLYDWDDEMYMSGVSAADVPAGIAGSDGDASGFQSVTVYDEAGSAYDPIVDNTQSLVVGKGYDIWFADDMTNWNAKTIDTRGTPNRGNIPLPVQNTGDGFNLVGNPYASSILWGSVTRSNIDATFYMLNNSGQFVSFGTSDEIPPHQGFWVYSPSGTPSITVTEASKTTTTVTSFNRIAKDDYLLIKLSTNATRYYHEIKMNFKQGSTNYYDNEMDGLYFKSPVKEAPTLTFAFDNEKEMIQNSLPEQDYIEIPLRMKGELDGEYTLEFSNLKIVNAYSCVMLKDLSTGAFINVKDVNKYSFAHKKDENPNRFMLILSKKGISCNNYTSRAYFSPDMVKFVFSSQLNAVDFDFDAETNVVMNVFDITGRKVTDEMNIKAKSNRQIINTESLSPGVYMISLYFNGQQITRKFVVQ